MMGNDDQLGAFQSRCEGKKNKKNKKKDFRAWAMPREDPSIYSHHLLSPCRCVCLSPRVLMLFSHLIQRGLLIHFRPFWGVILMMNDDTQRETERNAPGMWFLFLIFLFFLVDFFVPLDPLQPPPPRIVSSFSFFCFFSPPPKSSPSFTFSDLYANEDSVWWWVTWW